MKAFFDHYIAQIKPSMWLKKKQFTAQKQKAMIEQMKIHDDEFNALKRLKVHGRQESGEELIDQQKHRLDRDDLMKHHKAVEETMKRDVAEKEKIKSKLAPNQDKMEDMHARDRKAVLRVDSPQADRSSGHSTAVLMEHMKLMMSHSNALTRHNDTRHHHGKLLH